MSRRPQADGPVLHLQVIKMTWFKLLDGSEPNIENDLIRRIRKYEVKKWKILNRENSRRSRILLRMWRNGTQRCNEVRWSPGQEAGLAPPWSNLRYLGSKCTVLKKVLCDISAAPQSFGAPVVIRCPGNCAPLVAPLMGQPFKSSFTEGFPVQLA